MSPAIFTKADEYRDQTWRPHPTVSFQTQVSLIYDAVFVFAIGLQTLQHSSEILFSNVSCKDEKALHSGSSLINFINTVVSLVAFFVMHPSCSMICIESAFKLIPSYHSFDANRLNSKESPDKLNSKKDKGILSNWIWWSWSRTSSWSAASGAARAD